MKLHLIFFFFSGAQLEQLSNKQSSSNNSTALVASVSVLFALLFLMTGICLVYQRRRFVGM